MTNLVTIPLEDWFETTLAQAWNGTDTTIYVNSTPSFTFPVGSTCYVTVDPGLSKMQARVMTAYNSTTNTITVTTADVEKWAWVNYTAQSHWVGATVRITDNYQMFKDAQTAINSKLDQDWWNGLEYASTALRDAALWADWAATENYRMIKAGSTFYNYNLSTGQWQVISTGTAPTNATTSAAGIVEAPTTPEQVAGTTTGWTGALLFSTPDYVKSINDTLTASIDWEKLKIKSKQDVVVATTANITLSNTQTIDWVAVTAGQRVLVKDQTAWAENGIYLCVSGWAWTRTTDFDTNVNNEVDLWAMVWVQWGTVWAGTQWTLSTTGAITVWTTAIAFTQTYPATNYISSVALTSPLTVPAACNVILIEATAADAASRTQKWDIILTRTWKTTWSIQWAETNGTNNTPWVACSWSGSTLTTTLTGTTLWGTVYYYKSL